MMNSLSDLQRVQLDIFGEFIRVCESLHLRYYMVEGTMLGAVRHGGFIPWDDDIDVAMPRPDYDKFINNVHNILNKRYKLTTHLDPDHYWMTAILWDQNTKVELRNATEKILKNAWIDVIPLDGMPNGKLKQKLHYSHFYFYRALYQASHFSKIVNVTRTRKWPERMCIKLFQIVNLEKLFNSRKIGNRLHKIMAKYSFDDSDTVMQMISDYKMKELMPKKWFGEGRFFKFETLNAQGVSDADKYLTQLYGDYNKMPPKEKRVGKHQAIIIESEIK